MLENDPTMERLVPALVKSYRHPVGSLRVGQYNGIPTIKGDGRHKSFSKS